jgi:hypothetical protein
MSFSLPFENSPFARVQRVALAQPVLVFAAVIADTYATLPSFTIELCCTLFHISVGHTKDAQVQLGFLRVLEALPQLGNGLPVGIRVIG